MGFKPYLKEDVIVGKGGYVKLYLPHLGFKTHVWATLDIHDEEEWDYIGAYRVSFLGWNVPFNNLLSGCDYDNDLNEEQQKLVESSLTREEGIKWLKIRHPDDYLTREYLVLVHGEAAVRDAEADLCRENWDV